MHIGLRWVEVAKERRSPTPPNSHQLPIPRPLMNSAGGKAVAKRAFWGIADQGLSSLSNFALSLLVARVATPSSFGAFSIAIASYAVVLQLARGVVGLPLTIRYSTADHRAWTNATRESTGTALALGAAFGVCTALTGVSIGGQLGKSLVILGVGLPGLLLQDTWRYGFFACKRGKSAFLNDSLWTFLFLSAAIAMTVTGAATSSWLMTGWVTTAFIAAGFGSLQAGLIPKPSRTLSWLRHTRNIGLRFALESLVITGTAQLAFFSIGAILGLSSLGSVRGAYTLLGPLNPIFFGMIIMGVPEAVRVVAYTPDRLLSRTTLASGGLASIAIIWSVIMLALPTGIGEALIGNLWVSSRVFLLPMSVFMVFTGIQIGSLISLRGLAAARSSLAAALVSGPTTLLVTVASGLIAGTSGAAWGLAGGRAFAAALSWFVLWRVISRTRVRDARPGRESGAPQTVVS